jgi:UDP-N-acetylglucosamine acyltransferase
MGCVLHQHSVVGAGVMLGMGSIVTKDVPPYVTFYAGEAHKLNRVGMQRLGRSDADIDALQAWYRAGAGMSLRERMTELGQDEAWWREDVQHFLSHSHRNICETGGI